MPSVSRAQQRLMRGVASGSIKGKGKPSKAVANEFIAADSARGPKKLPSRVGSSQSSSASQPSSSMQSTRAMGSALPPAQKRGGSGY